MISSITFEEASILPAESCCGNQCQWEYFYRIDFAFVQMRRKLLMKEFIEFESLLDGSILDLFQPFI